MNDFSTCIELSDMLMLVLARLQYFKTPGPLHKVQDHILIANQS